MIAIAIGRKREEHATMIKGLTELKQEKDAGHEEKNVSREKNRIPTICGNNIILTKMI